MTRPVPPIGTQVSALAAQDHDAPAATCAGVTVTRPPVDANRVARRFASLGVGCGDHVTIVLSNALDWVYSVVACWKLGAFPQPLSALLPDAELAALLELRRPALQVGRPDPTGVTVSAAPDLAPAFSEELLPETVSPDLLLQGATLFGVQRQATARRCGQSPPIRGARRGHRATAGSVSSLTELSDGVGWKRLSQLRNAFRHGDSTRA